MNELIKNMQMYETLKLKLHTHGCVTASFEMCLELMHNYWLCQDNINLKVRHKADLKLWSPPGKSLWNPTNFKPPDCSSEITF